MHSSELSVFGVGRVNVVIVVALPDKVVPHTSHNTNAIASSSSSSSQGLSSTFHFGPLSPPPHLRMPTMTSLGLLTSTSAVQTKTNNHHECETRREWHLFRGGKLHTRARHLQQQRKHVFFISRESNQLWARGVTCHV